LGSSVYIESTGQDRSFLVKKEYSFQFFYQCELLTDRVSEKTRESGIPTRGSGPVLLSGILSYLRSPWGRGGQAGHRGQILSPWLQGDKVDQGCRTGPPGYIGWRVSTTTPCHSQLYPPWSGTKNLATDLYICRCLALILGNKEKAKRALKKGLGQVFFLKQLSRRDLWAQRKLAPLSHSNCPSSTFLKASKSCTLHNQSQIMIVWVFFWRPVLHWSLSSTFFLEKMNSNRWNILSFQEAIKGTGTPDIQISSLCLLLWKYLIIHMLVPKAVPYTNVCSGLSSLSLVD
jgi:hypothetical protein